MMGPMGWSRAEYLAVLSGQADEAARRRFVEALREGDPDLQALLTEHKERAVQLLRQLTPGVGQEGMSPDSSRDGDGSEAAEAGDVTSDAGG